MATSSQSFAVRDHFENRAPRSGRPTPRSQGREKLGPVREEAKKTRSTGAQDRVRRLATRKTALILTLKSDSDLASNRIMKREQTSANRWHVEIRLEAARAGRSRAARWLENAYALAG